MLLSSQTDCHSSRLTHGNEELVYTRTAHTVGILVTTCIHNCVSGSCISIEEAGVHMEPPRAFQQLHISPCVLMYTHTCPTGYCGLSWHPCLSHFFPHHRSGQLKGICPGLLLSLSKLTFKQVPRVNSHTKTVL